MTKENKIPWEKIYKFDGPDHNRPSKEREIYYWHGHKEDLSGHSFLNDPEITLTNGYFITEEEAKELWELNRLITDRVYLIEGEMLIASASTPDKIIRLQEENAKLRKALEIYGDEKNWFHEEATEHSINWTWTHLETETKPWDSAIIALGKKDE